MRGAFSVLRRVHDGHAPKSGARKFRAPLGQPTYPRSQEAVEKFSQANKQHMAFDNVGDPVCLTLLQ